MAPSQRWFQLHLGILHPRLDWKPYTRVRLNRSMELDHQQSVHAYESAKESSPPWH